MREGPEVVDRRSVTRWILRSGLGLALAPLAGCSGFDVLPQEDRRVYGNKPYRPASASRFQPILNGYRAKFGLAALGIDDRLSAIATTYARRLAEANQMSHDLPAYGPLRKRLTDAGYAYLVAGENLGEGYRDIEEAFEGWRTSSGHEREMRDPDATVFGIGSAARGGGGYNYFWCLILAKPRPSGGPTVEPLVAVPHQTTPEPTTSVTFGGVRMPF